MVENFCGKPWFLSCLFGKTFALPQAFFPIIPRTIFFFHNFHSYFLKVFQIYCKIKKTVEKMGFLCENLLFTFPQPKNSGY